jgi:hypothetical protein
MKKARAILKRLAERLRHRLRHEASDGQTVGRGWVIPPKNNLPAKPIDWVYDIYDCRRCGKRFAIECSREDVLNFLATYETA